MTTLDLYRRFKLSQLGLACYHASAWREILLNHEIRNCFAKRLHMMCVTKGMKSNCNQRMLRMWMQFFVSCDWNEKTTGDFQIASFTETG